MSEMHRYALVKRTYQNSDLKVPGDPRRSWSHGITLTKSNSHIAGGPRQYPFHLKPRLQQSLGGITLTHLIPQSKSTCLASESCNNTKDKWEKSTLAIAANAHGLINKCGKCWKKWSSGGSKYLQGSECQKLPGFAKNMWHVTLRCCSFSRSKNCAPNLAATWACHTQADSLLVHC